MGVRINNTHDPLIKQLESLIGVSLLSIFKKLNLDLTPDVHAIHYPNAGASDSLMVNVAVKIDLVAKFHIKDAIKEAEGYGLLKNGPSEFTEHLIHPLPVEDFDLIWLMPLLDSQTLHKAIAGLSSNKSKRREDFIKAVYHDYIESNINLWKETRVASPPDIISIYIMHRINRGKEVLRSLWRVSEQHFDTTRLIFNGEDYGTWQTLYDTCYQIADSCSLTHSCTIHGDEHANNLMIFNEALSTYSNPKHWTIIDYVNTHERADWLLSIAKMLYWWVAGYGIERIKEEKRNYRYNVQLLEKTLKYNKRTNEIFGNYNEAAFDLHFTRLGRDLIQLILTKIETSAKDLLEHDENWFPRLKLALFAVLFGFPHSPVLSNFAIPIMMEMGLKCLHAPDLPSLAKVLKHDSLLTPKTR